MVPEYSPTIGVKVVGVFGVDGEAENADFLVLGSVSGAGGVVADEIEQLGPVGSVVDGLIEAADVGAGIDDVLVMGIVEDAIDEPTGADVDVLPGVGGCREVKAFSSDSMKDARRIARLRLGFLTNTPQKPLPVSASHSYSPPQTT